MVKINHELKLNYPPSVVYETFRDNPVALAEKIPQLEKVEVLEKEALDGGRHRISLKFYARSYLAELMKPILKPSMLRWVSIQDWDDSEMTNSYRVKTFYFTERVNVGGKWKFAGDGNGGTRVTVQGHVHIRSEGIPGIPTALGRVAGDMMERYLLSNSKPNLVRMTQALEKLLKQKYPN